MPILGPGTSGQATTHQQTTTVQQIVNCTSQDVRSVLGASGSDSSILLDYVNRCQLILLRASRWEFLRSDVVYFMTQREQTDYWIGASGSAPPGVVDTGLNLSDVDIIQRNSVVDVTHAKSLDFVSERPFANTLSTQDAQFRPGPPAEWRQDNFQPDTISLYPAPDNQNLYQPVPQTPYCTIVAGGALAQRTYYITCTFVDSLGNEGTASNREAVITVPANYLVVVNSPVLPLNITASGVTYNQYKVYASTVSQSESRQTASPIALGTNWTEPTSGLITSVSAPLTNNLTTMDGYIITFRYYRERQIVQNLTDIIQIPDDYKDIMCAGVNWYACQYLRIKDEAQLWLAMFKDGVREMVRDRNLHPKENDFIRPDDYSIGIGNYTPYIDVFESGQL